MGDVREILRGALSAGGGSSGIARSRSRRLASLVLAPVLILALLLMPSAAAAKQKVKSGLPLKAAPLSTLTGDNVGTLKITVRPVNRAKLGAVQITLQKSQGGGVLSRKRIADPSGEPQIVSLRLSKPLQAGTSYQLSMVGRRSGGGRQLSANKKMVFAKGGGGAPASEGGAQVQKVVVNWSGGNWSGRDVGGFVAPGIGYGEVVCNPQTQWVRFYNSEGSRETAMMNWTYKNWGSYQEKSLREAIYTTGTGSDFNEGLNKFTPPEKTSTGTFEGVISDRGPIGNPGGVPLAPVTTLSMNWEWNFTNSGEARCYVEAVFSTETAATTSPLARSLQVVWHGEANAAAYGHSSIEFPGLGTVAIRCEPGETPQLKVEAASGATITTREGSEDSSQTESVGPVLANLPNNGMVVLELTSGERILVASRWKMNDPDPTQNWCTIAAQVLSPGFPSPTY